MEREPPVSPSPALATCDAVAADGAPAVIGPVISEAGPAALPFSAATVNV